MWKWLIEHTRENHNDWQIFHVEAQQRSKALQIAVVGIVESVQREAERDVEERVQCEPVIDAEQERGNTYCRYSIWLCKLLFEWLWVYVLVHRTSISILHQWALLETHSCMSIALPSIACSLSIKVAICAVAVGNTFFRLLIENAGFVIQRMRFQREPRARNL